MRTPRRLATALSVCLAAAPLAAQESETERERTRRAEREEGRPRAPAAADDAAAETAVREVVERFKEALRSGDSATALALLHPDVRIYEGGHAETKEEYRRGHLEADMRFLGAVSAETTWDEVLNGDGMALYLSRHRAEGTFRDRAIDRRGTETIVLVRTSEGWRIRHVHWSGRQGRSDSGRATRREGPRPPP